MLPPHELYEVLAEASSDDSELILVHAMSGFVDAGSASTLATRQMLDGLESREIARFDVDRLHDYRARRPPITFNGDRFTDVELPELVVHELRDENERPFLLLVGPEPDTGWQRFTAAVGELTARWSVGRAISLQGIPWAAPHTRPVALTAHASDRSLIAGHPRWFGEIVIPGHIGAFVELSLARTGMPSMGFSAHVPHYLASAEFPPAAVALLEALARSANLSLPISSLAASGASVLAQVDEQVAASPETAEAVSALERQYDAVLAGRGLEGPSLMTPRLPDDEVASGEQLAAELERFLREQGGGTG